MMAFNFGAVQRWHRSEKAEFLKDCRLFIRDHLPKGWSAEDRIRIGNAIARLACGVDQAIKAKFTDFEKRKMFDGFFKEMAKRELAWCTAFEAFADSNPTPHISSIVAEKLADRGLSIDAADTVIEALNDARTDIKSGSWPSIDIPANRHPSHAAQFDLAVWDILRETRMAKKTAARILAELRLRYGVDVSQDNKEKLIASIHQRLRNK
jgi:hypothetical protein